MTPAEFADFVKGRRNSLGTLDAAEERSRGLITGTYINNIENLKVLPENISAGKFIGLGKALRISPVQLFIKAMGLDEEIETSPARQVAEMIENLPYPQQEDAAAIIETLYQRHGKRANAAQDSSSAQQNQERESRVIGRTPDGHVIEEAPFDENPKISSRKETKKKNGTAG